MTDFREMAADLRDEIAKPLRDETMTEQDAIERVAKAIYAHTNGSLTINGRRATWEQYKEHVSNPRNYLTTEGQTALDQATAAIAAHNAYLRERATDADVVEAVAEALWGCVAVESAEAQLALTAALDVMLGKEG